MKQFFLGIDIGTQGARVVLIDSEGELIDSDKKEFKLTEMSRKEQSPLMWWKACLDLLKKIIAQNKFAGEIKAISVTSTSGTVIPLDKDNIPLSPAFMYSDPRSLKEGDLCKETAQVYASGYTGFNSSSGLSKMLWFIENYPEKANRIGKWIHAADFISGKISGIWGVTDYTNALKSGYNLKNNSWPDYLFDVLKLKKEWMPEVFPSGKVIGKMEPDLANSLGLSNPPMVTTGITDGCASQIASGAIRPGDWNSTIGTTLVVKGVVRKQLIDPLGRFYSHKHPEGYWMPGGASNTGADWVTETFGNDLEDLERNAMDLMPTSHLSYPLRQKGERFPFVAPEAKGFEPKNVSASEHFTANMEGVAFIERYTYELAAELSKEKVIRVFSAGGGSLSQSWLRIRSNVLNLPVYKMKWISGAFGAAVLAASQTYFNGLTEAGSNLIHLEKEILPEKTLTTKYDTKYKFFIELLKEKKYIN